MKTASTWCHHSARDVLLILAFAVSISLSSPQKTTTRSNTTHKAPITVKKCNRQQGEELEIVQTSKPSDQPYNRRQRNQTEPKQFRSELMRRKRMTATLVKKKMEEYYECLNQGQTAMRNIYKAIVVKIGQTLVLKCHQCFQHGRTNQKRKEVTWKQFRQDGAIMSNIQPGHKYKLTAKRDLQIKAISLEDTGQYFCLRNNTYKAIYQVDVVRQLNYHIVEENTTTALLPNEPIPENNLELVSTWSSWTECSQCDKKGIRTKTGICTIRKLSRKDPIKPVDVPSFYMYDGGLPCRSSAIPNTIAQLDRVVKRKSEILISVCEIPCPTKPDQTIIKDRDGNVVDIIQPEYYSLHDKPELSEPTKREVIYESEGKRAVLKCRTVEKMIRWQNGTKALNFMTLRKRSNGRIFIDGNNWLHIRKTMLSDSAIYSCWKQEKLLSTIKLKVTPGHREDAGPYLTWSLAVIISVCLIWAIYNIYRGPQNRVAK